jgi:ubiquinone/menaquinone biosynthesis C-methylase UbiE
VDGSAQMLAIARHRLGQDASVKFVHSRLEDWKTDRRFDLIVTNFLFDCFPLDVVEEAVAKLGQLALPHAEWWIAEIQLPAQGIARWRSRIILRSLYLFFGWVADVPTRNIHSPDDALKRAGFSCKARTTWCWGLLKSERWRNLSEHLAG